MEKATISKLRIYPVKSLGHIELEEAEVGIHSLKNDRLFAMVDDFGRYVNGKRTNMVNQLQSEYDLPNETIWLSDKNGGEPIAFELRVGNEQLDAYLSDFFDISLHLVQSEQGELMDIPLQSSLTVVSKASLESLQKDIEEYSLENMRLRFRSNVELEGIDAFWEEKLFYKPGFGVRFKMGEVEMIGVSPRARCNVPPQNPETGEMDRAFAKNMMKSRKGTLSDSSNLSDFGNSLYYLTVNVYLPKTELGKQLSFRDEVKILEPVQLRS